VRVRVDRREREFHRVAHPHLVDVGHVEVLLVDEALLAGVHAADADLPHHFGEIAGTWPPISISSRGPCPHSDATGMPCTLPLGVNTLVLK
jgi:hypothetical protein